MDLANFPYIMLRCLILTIIIELIIGIILGVRDKKDLLNILLVNVITNPIVVSIPILIYLYYGYKYEIISLYVLEILTVIVEGFIYSKTLKYKKINPFLLSLLLNLSSYLIGELINML